MNVRELKELLGHVPDETLVGASGHYGEYREVFSAYLGNCSKSYREVNNKLDVFIIDIEEAGPAPD